MVEMESPKKKRPAFLRPIQVVLVGAIVYFFILPLIPGFRAAVNDLHTIDPYLLFVGIGFQALSLLAYSLLTKAALGESGHGISTLRLYRIQLSTKALGNIVPGGSAASSALGYRLVTMCGVPGPDAAFALATAGIGSAVVLNLILWLGLIISIPVRGVNALYGTAAIIGVILMTFAAFLIFGLVEGQGRSERVVRAIARRLRFDEHHAAEVLSHLGARIEGLYADKQYFDVSWDGLLSTGSSMRRHCGCSCKRSVETLHLTGSSWLLVSPMCSPLSPSPQVDSGLSRAFIFRCLLVLVSRDVRPLLVCCRTALLSIGCPLWWAGCVISHCKLGRGPSTDVIDWHRCNEWHGRKQSEGSTPLIGWRNLHQKTERVSFQCPHSALTTLNSWTIRTVRPALSSVCVHDNT